MSDAPIDNPQPLFCDLCPSTQPVQPWEENQYSSHLKLVHECEFCGMLCQTEEKRAIHWRRIHGKEYRFDAWHKIVGDEVVENFGRFVDVNVWQSPTAEFQGVPADPENLCRWIYPICVQMLEFKHPEIALFSPDSSLVGQAFYAETHFRAVKAMVATARFKRLKGLEGRALLIAKALALPNYGPGYAEQQLRMGAKAWDRW